ncbi:hypothetical protein fugu_002692 [Takifugu bimaculatus]|uniref:Uncharacterized protein n=1 Tax=Takifugu bimaculatus TaxID=433685 RepID=A0A4Z2BDP3_9TELE|nr:hypothetical protein fugu_002692 [Takifugu bimaculatus]
MPWHSFDGRLFHLKYLQAQSGVEKVVLLESDSFLSLFLCLRGKLMETCRKKGRILESRPNKREQGHKTTPGTSFKERLTGIQFYSVSDDAVGTGSICQT